MKVVLNVKLNWCWWRCIVGNVAIRLWQRKNVWHTKAKTKLHHQRALLLELSFMLMSVQNAFIQDLFTWVCLQTITFLTAGGDVASVSEWWQVAPCVCDLVNTGRTVGGLPGRSAERVRHQSVSMASHQTWRSLHPGTGAGKHRGSSFLQTQNKSFQMKRTQTL